MNIREDRWHMHVCLLGERRRVHTCILANVILLDWRRMHVIDPIVLLLLLLYM